MTFREFNARFMEPGAIWLMIIGVVSLCQPWIELLHVYSVTITLVGIILFNVAAHVPPPESKAREDQHG